ncbi:hypothetical protein BKA70DRAFT_1514037 [Coprinopsis sp. MPI-PUGE-AT-0042]|nr:hypothetical protein BKA70DRAFT_1514037 [Coprinopsis sp. MPI-PUGE-AT-0042]
MELLLTLVALSLTLRSSFEMLGVAPSDIIASETPLVTPIRRLRYYRIYIKGEFDPLVFNLFAFSCPSKMSRRTPQEAIAKLPSNYALSNGMGGCSPSSQVLRLMKLSGHYLFDYSVIDDKYGYIRQFSYPCRPSSSTGIDKATKFQLQVSSLPAVILFSNAVAPFVCAFRRIMWMFWVTTLGLWIGGAIVGYRALGRNDENEHRYCEAMLTKEIACRASIIWQLSEVCCCGKAYDERPFSNERRKRRVRQMDFERFKLESHPPAYSHDISTATPQIDGGRAESEQKPDKATGPMPGPPDPVRVN